MERVIFACVHNAGRSQIAAAFLKEMAEATLDMWRQTVDVDSRGAEERACILDLIDAPGLDLDVGEASRAQSRRVLAFFESAGNAPDPQLHAAADIGRDVSPHDDV